MQIVQKTQFVKLTVEFLCTVLKQYFLYKSPQYWKSNISLCKMCYDLYISHFIGFWYFTKYNYKSFYIWCRNNKISSLTNCIKETKRSKSTFTLFSERLYAQFLNSSTIEQFPLDLFIFEFNPPCLLYFKPTERE